MCLVCNKIWTIVKEEREKPQGFAFPPFLRRIVQKFETFNLQQVSKVKIFTVSRYCQTLHRDEVFIGIATENFDVELDSVQWFTPETCGGFTVVNTSGETVSWEERKRRDIFFYSNPDWEDWNELL